VRPTASTTSGDCSGTWFVVRDGVNVNIRLVEVGAAAPYFYRHRRGKYAKRLEVLAKRARAKKLGCGASVLELPTARTRRSQRGDRRNTE
jgi:endonuclease YncB( thermonuclease family)